MTRPNLRIAVIDSGVNAAHPHILGVAGGASIGEADQGEATQQHDYNDFLGHGTAVMAAIKEKAPGADYFAVRVFDKSLRTGIENLAKAIEWCLDRRIDLINLSLGTTNAKHASRFLPLIERAAEQGAILVAARDADGVAALPGSLPGVFGVGLDWDCPRESFRWRQTSQALEFYASGYPRPLPGVPLRRNLHGISFAVANMTGSIALACGSLERLSLESVRLALATPQSHIPSGSD